MRIDSSVVEPFDFAAFGARQPTSRARVLEVRIQSPPAGSPVANLTLEAIPSVAVAKCGPSSGDTSMPQDAERALPILERAIALEPDYAVAHAIIAWCHEQRYLRGGSAAGWHPQLPATRQPTHLCIVVLSG